MRWWIVVVLAGLACSASESERAQQLDERRRARDVVESSAIVEAAKTPSAAGRLIYDPPTSLARDTTKSLPKR